MAASKWTLYWSFRNQDHDTSFELVHDFDKADASLEVKDVSGMYGDTLLHIACQNGWLDIVKHLIEKNGCDPEVKDRGKQTPLHYACHHGHLDIVQYLIQDQKCDINAITPDQWTPFYYACRYGHLNVVEYLANIPGITSRINQQVVLKLVCEYGHTDTLLYLMNEQTFIPKNTPQLLCIAYKHGYLEIAHNLCSHLDNFQNMDLEKHRALFIFCCSNNRLDVLKQLSLDCRDANTSQFLELSNIGLHCACQEGHTDVVKYLVEECGCDINVRNKDGLTPIHLACKHGNSIEVVQYLLGRSDCNSLVRANDGNTPIHFACITVQFNPEMVKILVKHGANISEGTLSMLKNSSISNDVAKPAILSSLLKMSRCDPNTRNYAGVSPIQLATYPFIIKETIAHHAEVELFKWIMECSDEDRAIIKLQEYVDKNQLDLTQLIASNGDTILHVACVANKVHIVSHLLHSHKFDPNIKNYGGETPLRWVLKHYAYYYAYAYQNSMLNFEIDLQDSIYLMNNSGLQWKSLLDEVDDDGNTILHLACQANQLHIVELLLSSGCSRLLLTKNVDGYIPFELISSPKMIVDSLVLSDSYTFKPGTVQQFTWFCKNIDERTLKIFLNINDHYGIKWGHTKVSDCCTKYFILRVPDHPSFCILLEICLHCKEMPAFPETDSNEVTNCYVMKIVDSLADSNLESYARIEELLHTACKQNRYHFVEYLLSTTRCDANYLCNDVRPLYLTIHPGIMELLIRHGAYVGSDDIEYLMILSTVTNDTRATNHILALFKLLNKRNCLVSSRCNSKGDTALHLSVQYKNLEVTRYLLTEAGCDPNIRNFELTTPLHLATEHDLDIIQVLVQNGAKVQSESYIKALFNNTTEKQPIHVETLKVLMKAKQWHPNSVCTFKGDTALHLSARHHAPKVTHFLLTEVECDPNIKNVDGETLLQLLIPTWTSESEIISTIKDLMSTNQWDPNTSCNSKGDTALLLSVRHHKPKVIHFLLTEVECDPNVKNINGETLLQFLIPIWRPEYEIISTIKDLISTNQWDPNTSCNSKGDTALHLSARYYSPRVITFLLTEAKCDPNIRNKMGETLLIDLLIVPDTSRFNTWLDSEYIEIFKALMATNQWDPNSSCNSKGDTALHLVLKCRRPRLVHYLLSNAMCDPNSKNLINETPLQLATDTSIINDLIRYGSNPDNVYKLYGKSLKLKKPLKPPVKVFIVGNSGVGKSTLTEALKIETSLLTRAFVTRRRVSDVDEKTAGIVPHDFESKNYGCVTLYDFAGHREFYSSHAAFLHNVIKGSSPIFLLVVNISNKNDVIQQHILYWLSFVENQCSVVNCISHVIVIGSHADIVFSSGDDPRQKAMEISKSIKKMFESSVVKYVDIYAMDCQYPNSPGMTKLRNSLIEICNSVRIPEVIPFNAHCFHVFLLDKFRTCVAVTVQEIQDQIIKELNMKKEIARFLPNTCDTICNVCDELNNRGHILFLKNANNAESSWMIIDKACLLSEVTGTIFAPKDFKQHCQLAESTGVVPLSRLVEHFPDLKTEILIGFMTHLEFCHEILDRELLKLITMHHESLNITDTFISESERYYLFPGLISQQAPDNLWEENHGFKHHCGWILQCTRPSEFFSSRFLQVLLLRLAFSFALVKVEVDETIPAFQRECSIWKNGIFWGEIFGMETIVEVHSNSKTVILQIRCREEHLLQCIAQRSHIIRRILQCVQDFCPQIKTVDSFIHPSGATKFPINLTTQMPQFDSQKIAEAIVKFGDCCPLSVVSAKRTILLDDLITFEPYAEIGLSMLRNLHSDENNFGNNISDQVLKTISQKMSRKANVFVEIFKKNHLLSSTPAGEELLTVLKEWRDGCEGTYKCLKEKLDQYSIFAERNILELSKVPLQIYGNESDMDDTMDTNNNDSESEVPTCTEYDVSSAIAESEISKNYTDMPLQELPEFDNLDEDQVSSLPTYETAARLRTVKLSVSAGLSYSTADDLKDDATDNKSLQELPGYDEIDEDKTAAVFNSSFPTYETASKLNTTNLKMKGHYGIDEGDNDARRKTLPATPEFHQLDYLEGNGKKVKVIDAIAAVWDKVAIRLHFEGCDIARIARDHHQQSVSAATTVFIEWLDGKGRQPPSWAVLIKALKETELFTDIVNNLECILGNSDDFIAHNKPQEAVVSSCSDSGEQAEMKLERRSNLQQPDHKPKLSELKVLKGHGGRKVKVIEGVGDRWKDLAKSLDFNGPRIDNIDMKVPREQPEEACQQMLTEWLDGEDDLRGPVTWETLIQCLMDAGIMDVADRLNEFINS